MLTRVVLSAGALVLFVAQLCEAAPSIVVSPLGPTPSGNRLWNFQVVPDLTIAPAGTPMAVELAFAIDESDLIDVDVNTAVWDTPLPGNNPFTGTVTFGLWVDAIGDRTFGAFGSGIITTPGPRDLFLIETAGFGPTTLRYGVAASGHPSYGSIIAQFDGPTARVFAGYTGTIAVPEPTSLLVAAIGAATIAINSRRRRPG